MVLSVWDTAIVVLSWHDCMSHVQQGGEQCGIREGLLRVWLRSTPNQGCDLSQGLVHHLCSGSAEREAPVAPWQPSPRMAWWQVLHSSLPSSSLRAIIWKSSKTTILQFREVLCRLECSCKCGDGFLLISDLHLLLNCEVSTSLPRFLAKIYLDLQLIVVIFLKEGISLPWKSFFLQSSSRLRLWSPRSRWVFLSCRLKAWILRCSWFVLVASIFRQCSWLWLLRGCNGGVFSSSLFNLLRNEFTRRHW